MHIRGRTLGDLFELRHRARHERDAEQKDRLMAAALAAALAVERVETAEIQRALNRSRGFVQRWAYAYRDGGIEALKDKPRGPVPWPRLCVAMAFVEKHTLRTLTLAAA